MIGFIASVLLWTVVLGIFIGLMLTVEMSGIKRLFAVAIIALFVGFGVSAAFWAESTGDKRRWNDGYCPNCNVRWELVNVEHLRNSGEVYYWDCPQCGTVIKLHRQF